MSTLIRARVRITVAVLVVAGQVALALLTPESVQEVKAGTIVGATPVISSQAEVIRAGRQQLPIHSIS